MTSKRFNIVLITAFIVFVVLLIITHNNINHSFTAPQGNI